MATRVIVTETTAMVNAARDVSGYSNNFQTVCTNTHRHCYFHVLCVAVVVAVVVVAAAAAAAILAILLVDLQSAISRVKHESEQWRRQDLLRRGAKLEIRSWGTHGKLQGCSSCLMTNSFVTNAVLIKCELLTFAPADLAVHTIFACQL